MATLIGWLANCGSVKDDGTPNGSGSVLAFVPGTTNFASVYGDSAESAPLAQPIPLNAAGKATVYANAPVDIQVNDSSGAQIGMFLTANGLNARAVEVENAGFTGTTNTGTLAPGGKTSVDAALTSLFATFGGPDGLYQESPGAIGITIQQALRDISISVRSFGAKGDGSADDTTAIQTTINEVKRLGGGIVYFPPGTYLISSALSQTGTNGVSFVGAGSKASIITQINGTANGLTINTAQSFKISGLAITHSTSSTGVGISVTNSSQGLVIEDTQVSKFTTACQLDSVSNSMLRNILLTTPNGGGSRALWYTTGGFGNLVVGGQVGNAATGVEINTGGGPTTFLGVIFSNGAPFFLNNANQVVVVGCSPSTTPFSFGTGTSDITQMANGIEGSTADVLSGGSVTPSWPNGAEIRYRGTTTGAAYIVNSPNPTPSRRGVRLTLHFFNNAGGAVTGWNLSAIYHTTAAIPTTDLHHIIVVFEYDIDSAVWREISRSDTT